MKMNQLIIKNLLSFRDETTINFDPHFNILVGPNGGGKSNLMDIITIILRRYFLQEVQVYEGTDGDGKPFTYMNKEILFRHLPSVLETFGRNDLSWEVSCEFIVTEDDIQFIHKAHQNKDRLSEALIKYRDKPIANPGFIDEWWMILPKLKPGQKMRYKITSANSQTATSCGAENDQNISNLFLNYLNHRQFICRLAEDVSDLNLPDGFLYVSPYRGGTEQNLKANLSGQRNDDLFRQYLSATSRSTTSLLLLGTTYFAMKRRQYEYLSRENGYERRWSEDEEVKIVNEYVARLGYTWDLELVDATRNIYEISLTKGGQSFLIERASSGEKEILSFLLGIFAFNMRGGLVVIDEPELHLHPKWQATLRDFLTDLSKTTNNQIIIATHSPSFITSDNVQKVIRVYKDKEGVSRTTSNRDEPGAKLSGLDYKDLVHMVMSHNNEKMFFADQVVLVEGIMDRLLFNTLLEFCSKFLGRTDSIEVLEVRGKMNFNAYKCLLKSIGQKISLIADLDCITHLVEDGEELRNLFITDHKKMVENVVDNKKSQDRIALMKIIEEAVQTRDLSKIDINQLCNLYEHMASRHRRLRSDLTPDEENLLREKIETARKDRTFILSQGEIEDYLPEQYRNIDGLLRLIKPEELRTWLSGVSENKLISELIDIVLSILDATDDEREYVMKGFTGACTEATAGSAVL